MLTSLLQTILKGLGKFLGLFFIFSQGKKNERLDNAVSKNKKARESDKAKSGISNSSDSSITKFFLDGMRRDKDDDKS